MENRGYLLIDFCIKMDYTVFNTTDKDTLKGKVIPMFYIQL